MTDLRAMSWPERLQWAVENDLGGAELAHVLGVTQPAVSSAQIHWGIKLRDMRRLRPMPGSGGGNAYPENTRGLF